tara:strand:+ start:956 stop:1186 length:231 start_codon:yes stop_codon:yes gene_type:complete
MLDLYTDDMLLVTIYASEADALKQAEAAYASALIMHKMEHWPAPPPRSAFLPMARRLRAAGLTVTVWAVVDPSCTR